MDPDVEAAINATAARAGMTPDQWRAMAQIESGLKPGSNYGAGTQYKGLFQVGSRGPQSEWARHGSGNIYNPMDNARAAAELAYENNQGFKNHFGRDPTPRETYLMHQQGLGFYTNGTMTNIAGNLPDSAKSNPANWTHAGFEKYWGDRLERFANSPIPEGSPIDVPTRSAGSADTSRWRSPSGGGGISSKWVASGDTGGGEGQPSGPTDTAQQQPEDTFDVGAAMGDVQKRIAQQQQEDQPPPLQPMTVQPLVTPSMQQLARAKMLAQIMALRDQQGGSTTT